MMEVIQNYWLEFVLTLISGTMLVLVKSMFAQMKAYKQGMIGMLKFRLFKECNKYLAIGNITVDEMETISDLHSAYNGMGLNHTGDELYSRARQLPIIPYRQKTSVVYETNDVALKTFKQEEGDIKNEYS